VVNTRLCDLKVSLAPFRRQFDRLYRELRAKNIRFRPHFWLSTEWFTVDGIPGVAIPFYLYNEDLMDLERSQMGFVEGSGDYFMKYLRHEVGHAICTAYNLQRRAAQVFGSFTRPYEDAYVQQTRSPDYVWNLGQSYAQSHPVDDFAETFAVWLADEARKKWTAGAARKLEFMDRLMATKGPVVYTSRARPHHLKDCTMTLDEYYIDKLAQLDQARGKGLVLR